MAAQLSCQEELARLPPPTLAALRASFTNDIMKEVTTRRRTLFVSGSAGGGSAVSGVHGFGARPPRRGWAGSWAQSWVEVGPPSPSFRKGRGVPWHVVSGGRGASGAGGLQSVGGVNVAEGCPNILRGGKGGGGGADVALKMHHPSAPQWASSRVRCVVRCSRQK